MSYQHKMTLRERERESAHFPLDFSWPWPLLSEEKEGRHTTLSTNSWLLHKVYIHKIKQYWKKNPYRIWSISSFLKCGSQRHCHCHRQSTSDINKKFTVYLHRSRWTEGYSQTCPLNCSVWESSGFLKYRRPVRTETGRPMKGSLMSLGLRVQRRSMPDAPASVWCWRWEHNVNLGMASPASRRKPTHL